MEELSSETRSSSETLLSSEAMFGSDFGAERMWGLKELMLPAETFSPQTIAWLWLAGMLIVLLMIAAWRRYQFWKSQSYRRDALKSLASMHNDFSQINSLPLLLRHAALMSSPREEVIAASGVDWILWLNQKAGDSIFDEDDAQLLNHLAYGKNIEIERATETERKSCQHLINATESWIRAHHA